VRDGARDRDTRPPRAKDQAPAASARPVQTNQARALALQRAAGNRATGRILARWTAHPDKDKKGAVVPDGVAAEYLHFNPPKNQ
jgi:hypothetical protein